jgi:predicted adenylyl cyclase CyaB
MIEVEKKFQPTEEQLKALLVDAKLIKEKELIDVYYDTSDFYFAKKGMRLRSRGGVYELKIGASKKSEAQVAREMTDEKEILQVLGFTAEKTLADLVKEKLQVACKIVSQRKEYSKLGFTIDVDITDFGYNVTEIELIVANEADVKQAEEKVLSFAQSFGLEVKDLPIKPLEYMKRKQPDLYKELYG